MWPYKGDVKTAANGKGAISQPASCLGPSFQTEAQTASSCLRDFPRHHPAPTGSEGEQEQGSPDMEVLSGDRLQWAALEHPCFLTLLSSLETRSHKFCKEQVLSQANHFGSPVAALLLSWKSGHLSGESSVPARRPPARGCQGQSIDRELQGG